MLHYTYRIDNLINGKYYIGKHSSDSLNDNYMGSGPLIKAAIAKYGMENFKKTILKTFPTSEEAFEHEAQIVTMVEVNDPMCYNIQPGGKGGQKRFTDEELKEHALEQQRKYKKEYNQRNKERRREYYQQPEVKERRKEYRQRPEAKEQQRKYKKEYRQRPEVKEKYRGYNQRPEVKEHRREYRRECYQRPEVKEQQRKYKKEYYQRPEVKERQKEYHRERYKQKKMKQMKTI